MKPPKVTVIRLQGQTGDAYPLGDPAGFWYGDDWLTPAEPDLVMDEVQRLCWQTRRLKDVPGYPQGAAPFTDTLSFITKHGTPAERIRARRLRAQLRRRAELAPTET